MPSERRLHPLAIVFDVGRQIGALAVPLLLLVFGASSEGYGSELIAVALLVPYAGMAIGRYLTFRYRYDDRDLVVRSGLVTKNERHIPYDRIQNIDAVQNVLHRLFGVVEVRVQTGSGSEAEATFGAVPMTALEEMRAHVFARRSPAAATDGEAAPVAGDAPGSAATAATAAPPRTLLRLSPRDLVAYGVIENRGFIVIAAAFGLLWEIGPASGVFERVAGEDEQARGVIRSLVRQIADGGGILTALWVLPLVVVALMAVSRVFSIAWALVQLHAFTLTRVGEDLRAEYGWLTRVTATVPLRRIQTVTVREGLWHRVFKRASVRVSTAGGSGPQTARPQREWLAPILRRDQVERLVGEILPGFDLAQVRWRPIHPRAFRRAIKPRATVALVAAAVVVLAAGTPGLWLAPPLFGWAVLATHLYVRRLGWALLDDAVLFRRGAFSRFVTIARFAKIQAVELHETPFDRRTGMLCVRVDTAGAGESFRVDVPFLPRDEARALGRRLAVEAAETTFRW
jgi:putative membrane protein